PQHPKSICPRFLIRVLMLGILLSSGSTLARVGSRLRFRIRLLPRLILVRRLLVNLMVSASWGSRFVVNNCLVMRLTARLSRVLPIERPVVMVRGRMLVCSLRNLTGRAWFGSPRTVHHLA